MEKVVSGKHGDEQNNVTEDPVETIHVETPNVTSNDLAGNADMERLVFVNVQEEPSAEDLPSTKMVTEVALSPSMRAKCKYNITEKRKTVKSNL